VGSLLGMGAHVKPATISNLEDRTTVDERTGAMHSIQAADLSLPETALNALWSPMNLERLARTYWRFLTRVTLGLVRVRYTQTGRSLVLLTPAVKLIAFAPPEYEMEPGRGIVRWRIARGLLVARRGRGGGGYLQIEVRRRPDLAQTDPVQTEPARTGQPASADPAGEKPSRVCLHVEVEVAGFYPAIASGLGRRFYGVTQSRIHVLITHGFLRSLARLDLAESRVGRFAGAEDASDPSAG
jgi:hypothetical protein